MVLRNYPSPQPTPPKGGGVHGSTQLSLPPPTPLKGGGVHGSTQLSLPPTHPTQGGRGSWFYATIPPHTHPTQGGRGSWHRKIEYNLRTSRNTVKSEINGLPRSTHLHGGRSRRFNRTVLERSSPCVCTLIIIV